MKVAPPALVLLALIGDPAAAQTPAAGERLIAAYPLQLERVDGNDLVWKDGSRMPVDDGRGVKPFEAWLAAPDLKDMLAQPYPTGEIEAPPRDFDPGRARNAAFFARMYGDCTKGEAERHLVFVPWLPKRQGGKMRVTSVNGVDRRLAAISAELDQLPASYDRFLVPPAGGYVCRPIQGTSQPSAHGYGIAVDIAPKVTDYWRWTRPDASGAYTWRNRVPAEIVRVFEKHGFVWGGRWHHFDTMHFEYRPELLPPTAALPSR
jgi:hypothetical protein